MTGAELVQALEDGARRAGVPLDLLEVGITFSLPEWDVPGWLEVEPEDVLQHGSCLEVRARSVTW